MTQSASLQRMTDYARTKLGHLECAAHRVMDREHEWWPFTFLRPEPEAYFTSLRVTALSCLYGLPAALFAVLTARIMGDPLRTMHLPTLLAFACGAFFVLYRSTFAYFWNRRAERLQRLRERRASWREGRRPAEAREPQRNSQT
jgi:hypothetical protein